MTLASAAEAPPSGCAIPWDSGLTASTPAKSSQLSRSRFMAILFGVIPWLDKERAHISQHSRQVVNIG
jgi:hypothetical protein